MPKDKRESPNSERSLRVESPVRRPIKISEALELLQSAAIPSGFLKIAREFVPGKEVLFPITPEDYPRSAEIEVPSIERPMPETLVEPKLEMPAEPWPEELPEPQLEAPVEPVWEEVPWTEPDVPPEPPEEVPREGGAETFYLTDLRLDLSGVADMTPGLVPFVGTPLGSIIGNIFFWQDPRVAAAAYLGPCAAKAQLGVQPVLLKARVAVELLPEGQELDVPDRDKAIKAAEDALKEAAARVRADGAATDEVPSNLGDQKTTEERAWREKRDRASKDDLARAAQRRPKGDTQHETIRFAGQTVITHRICTFWSHDSYLIGQETIDCCVLRNIWVQPRAQVRINPQRKLYIKDTGSERINQDQYDRLTQNRKKDYVLAEPYSIEAHEREHVADYVSLLKSELAELRFRAFVTTKAEWEANDRRVRDHVQHICDLTYERYTLRELKLYPHGHSEEVAVDTQRKAIKVGEGAARAVFGTADREAQEEVERYVKEETAGGRPRCLHQPEATPHCLRAD